MFISFRLLLPLLLMMCVILATEGVSLAGLAVLDFRGIRYPAISDRELPRPAKKSLDKLLAGRNRYLRHDPRLGWSIHPKGEGHGYRANAQGIRGDVEYDTIPRVRRLAAFGDSFTHGDDVRNPDTWEAQLADSATEVMNFGVPFYGLDQALLRYELEGRAFRPHVVLIGFTAENLTRSVSQYRPFYRPPVPFAFAKPGFRLEHDTLVAIPHPLPTLDHYRRLRDQPDSVLPLLGAWDWHYQHRPRRDRWDLSPTIRLMRLAWYRWVRPMPDISADPVALRVSLALFDRVVASVRRDGREPVILLFPRRDDLPGPAHYLALRETLEGRGYRVIDLSPAFADCGACDSLFNPVQGHFNGAGNRRVAEYLRPRLMATGSPPP